MALTKIPSQIFKDLKLLEEPLNDILKDVFARLAALENRTIQVIQLQVKDTLDNTFPVPLANPGYAVSGITICNVRNVESPSTTLSGGCTAAWQQTQSGLVITSIPGLDVETKYEITLEVF